MGWIRLVASIAIFTASCIGLGYLAGFCVSCRKWPWWVSSLLSFAIACLWPAVLLGSVIYSGRRYAAEHSGEVNDAAGMVLMSVISVIPFIFFIALALASIGSLIARRKGTDSHG